MYSYREKIETEGKPISREKFAEQTTRVAAVIEEMTAEGLAHPTPFEIETAVAFLFFAEEGLMIHTDRHKHCKLCCGDQICGIGDTAHSDLQNDRDH